MLTQICSGVKDHLTFQSTKTFEKVTLIKGLDLLLILSNVGPTREDEVSQKRLFFDGIINMLKRHIF